MTPTWRPRSWRQPNLTSTIWRLSTTKAGAARGGVRGAAGVTPVGSQALNQRHRKLIVLRFRQLRDGRATDGAAVRLGALRGTPGRSDPRDGAPRPRRPLDAADRRQGGRACPLRQGGPRAHCRARCVRRKLVHSHQLAHQRAVCVAARIGHQQPALNRVAARIGQTLALRCVAARICHQQPALYRVAARIGQPLALRCAAARIGQSFTQSGCSGRKGREDAATLPSRRHGRGGCCRPARHDCVR